MADYYPLIARAVEGLSQQNPEARRAVYERARRALTSQLRSLHPPLSEAEIDHETLALEGAIGRLEARYDPTPAGLDLQAFSNLLTEDRQPSGSSRGLAPNRGLRAPAPQAVVEHEPDGAYAEPALARPKVDSRPHPSLQDRGRGRNIVFGAILAVVILAIAALAWWQGNPASAPPAPEQVAEAAPPAPQEAPKISERVGAPAPAPAPSPPPESAQAISVAQRAVFYEEDPTRPQTPKAQVGRAVWRLEDVNPGRGQALEKAVSAQIEVPDAGLAMRLMLRRNLDATLPASHTVELTFTTRAGETGRVIRDVGLLQFKNEEAARGTPVAGLPVPVGENLFLIGLSNLQSDVERNTELFVRRNWIDLPVRMASGQRAILSFEKGAAGEQVLTSAFSQWQ
jgi:hypothetical protein